uniref:Sushi domain-containing protein n=1 Tax=Gopherus evgoodei TaxID=1825980 RepID=A0A8C4VP16_9SAUR
ILALPPPHTHTFWPFLSSLSISLCDCDEPPRFHFAELKEEYRNRSKFAVNSKVEYSCRSGYSKVQKSILRCMSYSQWSDASIFKPSSCVGTYRLSMIKLPLNLLFENNLFPAGTVVKYNCMGGYELIPGISSASVTCQKDFTWSEQQEFCRSKHITCEPPAHIANGQDNRGWKNVFLVGSSVSYSCNRGWLLVGESSIRCTAGDGGTPRWDAPVPECKGDSFLHHTRMTEIRKGWRAHDLGMPPASVLSALALVHMICPDLCPNLCLILPFQAS